MKQKNVCAYLDLLGFKYFLNKNPEGALNLLRNYQTTLNLKVINAKIAKKRAVNTQNQRLKTLIQNIGISSFDYFLPFSDSIFIQSSNADLFLPQLSFFLLSAFQLSGHIYSSPENPQSPTTVTMHDINIEKNGHPKIKDVSKEWFPLFFRGGISYGDCSAYEMSAFIKNQESPTINLVGKAVVEAVQLEQIPKGPCIYCSNDLYTALSYETKKYIVKEGNYYELLWPAFTYSKGNDVNLELINQFEDLFQPAVTLWKAYNHLSSGIYYYNFLKLIIKSTLHYFSNDTKSFNIAKKHVKDSMITSGLELKTENIMSLHYT